MARLKSVYICSECGFESPKWNGKCSSCGAWNTFVEEVIDSKPAGKIGGTKSSVSYENSVVNLSTVDILHDEVRFKTGLSELDRVLGGGIVKGSLVLLTGEPGIGKSTILLQICQFLGENYSILYVSGEESARQIKLRAQRLKVDTNNLYLLTKTDAVAICETVTKLKPDFVIIDSIQTMTISELSSSAGSVTQVRECTNLFMKSAKDLDIPYVIVGHVNKDGHMAGPKVMEHIVDAVLYFEGQRTLNYRILRAVKNRFGSTNEIGIFEMGEKGLAPVENPSYTLLSQRPQNVSGSCVACIMEGSRPILTEVQSLVAKSPYSTPKRTSTGFDYNRAAIIIAVLEKRLGYLFSQLDVYINIVGGLSLDDTAGDLPVALSLYSCLTDKIVSEKTLAIGEIGLLGELRSVGNMTQRIKEAQRLGFEKVIIPYGDDVQIKDYDIKIVQVKSLKEAFLHI